MFEDLIALDPDGDPLPTQIYRAIGAAVRGGRLGTGAALPSSRELARALGVSRNSVNAAYELLRADGTIVVRRGAVPSIASGALFEDAKTPSAPTSPGLSRRGDRLAANLRGPLGERASGQLEPGAPDETLFPADLWARTLRRVARRRFGAGAIYGEMAGLGALRVALAGYLGRHRGVAARPDQIIVLPSTQSALALIAHCLADRGDLGMVESPGYFGARTAFYGAGLDTAPLEVDGQGADPSAIVGHAPRLIYLTPSHQYPTGARMSLQRRLDVLEAARRVGAVIIEDDYDSEFLWQGRAIAALQGISRGDAVIYLGTTAKSLLPGLRLAYMVVPDPLVGPLAQAQRNLGLRANIHAQAALAELIESGALLTHLNRIAKDYEARGKLLVETLSARFADVLAIDMPMGGLQSVARFVPRREDRPVARHLFEQGFETPALSSYCSGQERSGLIIGFADATPPRLQRFSAALSAALRLT